MKVKADTIARTIILVVALVNQILSVAGKAVLPITDDQIEKVVSLTFTIVVSLWTWWKNNSVTKAAIQGDQLMNRLKKNKEA
jgi:SPP1 family holin